MDGTVFVRASLTGSHHLSCHLLPLLPLSRPLLLSASALLHCCDFVLIRWVSLLQDPFRIHCVRFFSTDGQTQEAPGKANRRSRKFLY